MHPWLRLAILVLVVTLTACGRAGSSETPSAGASASSEQPSPSATEGPDATPDEASRPLFQNEALATVRVDGLEVRSAAGLSAPVLDDPFGEYAGNGTVVLDAGDRVLVIGDATWSDGQWWLKIATDRVESAVVVGFVAAGTPGAPSVEEDNAFCPGEGPSLTELIGLTGVERLGCYASIPLSFAAYRATVPPDAGLGGACDPGTRPEWLVCEHINYNWVNPDGGTDWDFLLHFDPALGIPETGLIPQGSANPQIEITGHFDDQAAILCAPNPPTSIEEAAAYVTCRTLFVVEALN